MLPLIHFHANGRQFPIDTRQVADINLARYFMGILPGTLTELVDLFKEAVRKKGIDCAALKQWYDSKIQGLKRPLVVFGFRGYKVHYWKIKDGDAGYVRLGKKAQVRTIMDKKAYRNNHMALRLAGAGIFLFFSTMPFLAFYNNLLIIFSQRGG